MIHNFFFLVIAWFFWARMRVTQCILRRIKANGKSCSKKTSLKYFWRPKISNCKKKNKEILNIITTKPAKKTQRKISYPIFELIMCIVFLKCYFLFGIVIIQNQFNRALNFSSYSWKKKTTVLHIMCSNVFPRKEIFFFFVFFFWNLVTLNVLLCFLPLRVKILIFRWIFHLLFFSFENVFGMYK